MLSPMFTRINIILCLLGKFSCFCCRLITFFKMLSVLNSLIAGDDICHLLITFTNSLDPDQDRHVYKVFDTLIALDIFEIVNFEKLESADNKH